MQQTNFWEVLLKGNGNTSLLIEETRIHTAMLSY